MAAGDVFSEIGAKIATYLLLIPLFTFYGLLLTGCISTSAGIPNLHILQFNGDDRSFLRVGYYGICIIQAGSDDICVQTGFVSSSTIMDRFIHGSRGAALPSDSIRTAIAFQKRTLINVLAIAAILLFLGILLDLLRLYTSKKSTKRQLTADARSKQNAVRQYALAMIWGSSGLALGAAIANTQMGRSFRLAAGGSVSVGTASLALHWTVWGISLIFGVGYTMMRRSRSSPANSNNGFGASSAPLATQGAPMGIVTI